MRIPPTLRVAAGCLALAGLAFGLTALVRLHPWDLQAVTASEAQAMDDDVRLLWDGLLGLPAPSAFGPDLVLIVMDTVRADRLELYGGPQTMPHLTRWAQGARVYTHAVAESPWTLSSHASLFTGQAPAQHRATGRTLSDAELEQPWRKLRKGLDRPLSRGATTLAERLSAAGWLTLGLAANQAYLQPHWRLDQGFQLWLCDQLTPGLSGLPYVRGDRISNLALEVLEFAERALPYPEGGGRSPMFLFLNYMEAHLPYAPRRGYVADPQALVLLHRTGTLRHRLVNRVLAQKQELPQRVYRGWLEAYDAELRYLDAQLGTVLQALDERGYTEHGYVVIVSDHGEYFGEHHLLEHSKDVYQPALHIPLLVKGPGVEPGLVDEPVQLAQVARWMTEWAGVEPLPASVGSPALQVSEIYGSRARDLASTSSGSRFNRVRRAFRDGEREVILGSDGSLEAYDLGDDPEEARDLSGDARWVSGLVGRGRSWMLEMEVDDLGDGDGDGDGDDVLDAAEWELLRGLGYVE